jgi:hypothetical protein
MLSYEPTPEPQAETHRSVGTCGVVKQIAAEVGDEKRGAPIKRRSECRLATVTMHQEIRTPPAKVQSKQASSGDDVGEPRSVAANKQRLVANAACAERIHLSPHEDAIGRIVAIGPTARDNENVCV